MNTMKLALPAVLLLAACSRQTGRGPRFPAGDARITAATATAAARAGLSALYKEVKDDSLIRVLGFPSRQALADCRLRDSIPVRMVASRFLRDFKGESPAAFLRPRNLVYIPVYGQDSAALASAMVAQDKEGKWVYVGVGYANRTKALVEAKRRLCADKATADSCFAIEVMDLNSLYLMAAYRGGQWVVDASEPANWPGDCKDSASLMFAPGKPQPIATALEWIRNAGDFEARLCPPGTANPPAAPKETAVPKAAPAAKRKAQARPAKAR